MNRIDRDEKSILLAQISMLQSNSEGLGSRLEAISQAADSAMLREREAEEKLDAALSVHARQLSQRQVCYVCSIWKRGQCFMCSSNVHKYILVKRR